MEEDRITMSTREIERLKIIHKVMEKRLTQMKARELMGATDLQIRGMLQRVREKGERGIVHENRGRPSPHKIPKVQEEKIIALVQRRYSDFGPTFLLIGTHTIFNLNMAKHSPDKNK
jgi:hypothetical protein